MDRQPPGSDGEHRLQQELGTTARAQVFYRTRVGDRLNPWMRQFIREQEMIFIATADVWGECDCSFRAGLPGFVRILDERTLAYPEYRGNGVYASLGNCSENPHLALLFLDFFRHTIGLHVNGRVKLLLAEEFCRRYGFPQPTDASADDNGRRTPKLWVVIEVEEAYVHCAKHIPRLAKLPKEIDWGTDDPRKRAVISFTPRMGMSRIRSTAPRWRADGRRLLRRNARLVESRDRVTEGPLGQHRQLPLPCPGHRSRFHRRGRLSEAPGGRQGSWNQIAQIAVAVPFQPLAACPGTPHTRGKRVIQGLCRHNPWMTRFLPAGESQLPGPASTSSGEEGRAWGTVCGAEWCLTPALA